MLIAVENGGAHIVVVVAAVEMIVVAGRVVHRREWHVLHLGNRGSGKFPAQIVEIFRIGAEAILFVVGQSVETHILLRACIRGILESIG